MRAKQRSKPPDEASFNTPIDIAMVSPTCIDDSAQCHRVGASHHRKRPRGDHPASLQAAPYKAFRDTPRLAETRGRHRRSRLDKLAMTTRPAPPMVDARHCDRSSMHRRDPCHATLRDRERRRHRHRRAYADRLSEVMRRRNACTRMHDARPLKRCKTNAIAMAPSTRSRCRGDAMRGFRYRRNGAEPSSRSAVANHRAEGAGHHHQARTRSAPSASAIPKRSARNRFVMVMQAGRVHRGMS